MAFRSLDPISLEPHNLFRHFTHTEQGLIQVLATAYGETMALLVRKEQLPALTRALSISDSNPQKKVSSVKRSEQSTHGYCHYLKELAEESDVKKLRVATPTPADLDAELLNALSILDRPDRYAPEVLRELKDCFFEFARKWCNNNLDTEFESGSNPVYAIVVDRMDGVTNESDKNN